MGKNAKVVNLESDGTFGHDGCQSARLTAYKDIRKGKCLNLGCGFTKFIGDNWTNVDKYDICAPDMVVDLNIIPYPWEDNTFDYIYANHVMEHLKEWWGPFTEIARILKPDGHFEMRVPDESSSSAITYRDHHHIFHINSFHGIGKDSKTLYRSGTNAWAATVERTIPLELIHYHRVPFKKYNWMKCWPFIYVLEFCANHMRNFIWEQQFIFKKF